MHEPAARCQSSAASAPASVHKNASIPYSCEQIVRGFSMLGRINGDSARLSIELESLHEYSRARKQVIRPLCSSFTSTPSFLVLALLLAGGPNPSPGGGAWAGAGGGVGGQGVGGKWRERGERRAIHGGKKRPGRPQEATCGRPRSALLTGLGGPRRLSDKLYTL